MPRPTQQPRLSATSRWVLLFTLGAFGISGATTVYLVGSHNRSADKTAVLRYEASVLAQVREMSVVGGSMADAADSYAAGRLSAKAFAASTTEWEQTFIRVGSKIAAIPVPLPFGAHEQMFAPAAREFANAANLYAAAADCVAKVMKDCPTTNAAGASAVRALTLYRSAAKVLQDTRVRLGLGRSPNFDDPPR